MSRLHSKIVLNYLSKLDHGQLVLRLPNGIVHTFGPKQFASNPLHIEINNWKVFKYVISSGDIGFAETFIKGWWTAHDLEGVLRLALKNRPLLNDLFYGTWLGSLTYKIKHFLRRNTRKGSKRNIHAHYDLGNDFYSLWLDPSMLYSSALFGGNHNLSLTEAQVNKCKRILEQLDLPSGSNVLEIGCGWGEFMNQAKLQGISVTGLTLSTEQKRFVDERFANSSNHQAVILDYRDCNEQFDGIASIEMFEAVGEEYWPDYFEALERCLKPGKRAVIQTIVIDDSLFEKYRTETDFIQQYVFPGGMLPSTSKFIEHAKAVGLMIKDQFNFGLDYASTLRIWRENFNQKLTEIKQLGFNDEFIRLWNFYLMYCAAGFAEQSIDVIQFTLEKPHHAS